MDAITTMWLFVALATKHLIVDFPLQAFPYQYRNKGTYGHPGGLLHAGLHVVGTLLVLLVMFLDNPYILALAWLDGWAHYHIDWLKMNVNKRFSWGPTTHEQFWIAVGVDQWLHFLTYAVIVYAVI